MSDTCSTLVPPKGNGGRGIVRPVPRATDILDAIRQEYGLDDADLASASGLGAKTIERWRRGERIPSDLKLARTLSSAGVNPTKYGLPPTPEPPAPLWAQRLERKVDGLIAFHRSGGNPDHLEGL